MRSKKAIAVFLTALQLPLCTNQAFAKGAHREAHRETLTNEQADMRAYPPGFGGSTGSGPRSEAQSGTYKVVVARVARVDLRKLVYVRIVNKNRGELQRFTMNQVLGDYQLSAPSGSTEESFSFPICGSPCNRVVKAREVYQLEELGGGTHSKKFMLAEYAGGAVEIEAQRARPGVVAVGALLTLSSAIALIPGAILLQGSIRYRDSKPNQYEDPVEFERAKERSSIAAWTTTISSVVFGIIGIAMIKKGRFRIKMRKLEVPSP